jgi:hypothetical protein
MALKTLFDRTHNISFNRRLDADRAHEIQVRTLKKLLNKAKDTHFGEYYNFEMIMQSSDPANAFRENVPLSDYMGMLPWWNRLRQGESDVIWPGQIRHFALSSGTSDGSSKYIPVSKEMLRSIQRASIRQLLSVLRSDVPIDYVAKNWLMVGGSTDLEYNGMYYSGDLSGITTGRIPVLFQRFSKPGNNIRRERNWKEKIEKMTLEAEKWDVGMVAGVPAWIQMLFESIISHYKLNNIHEIWPHLEVYLHGGVSLSPYKKSIDRLLGRPIKYFETYLASEGFIAFQNRQEHHGMRMLLRNGIFYEFVPFNDDNFNAEGHLLETAKSLFFNEIEEGKEYALIMSTCAGAWRYLIGDTIRFTSLEHAEIEITGRTKHFISLCGEHLSVDNMNHAIDIISTEFGFDINEFAVAGIPHHGFFAHQWYIACEQSNPDVDAIKEKLDLALKVLNDDYRVERSAALYDIFVQPLPPRAFMEWMDTQGKLGSQHKFPRVLKGEKFENWQQFLFEKGYIKEVQQLPGK